MYNQSRGEGASTIRATILVPVCEPRALHQGRSYPQKDGPNKSKYLDRANNLLPSILAGNFEKKQKANKRTSQWNEEKSSENFLKKLINEMRKRRR
ncbi:hypothetical protein PCYB_062970, partial [Plasmodium cynomolgi strain B]